MAVNFDKIAPLYDPLSRMVFGDALQKSQLCTLGFIPEHATVLIIGGGTGWYLKYLLQQQKVKKVVYVEASAAMLRLSRQKIAPVHNTTEVEFRLGTEQSIRADERFDVVITHFIFDLFAEPHVKKLIHIFHNALRQNGIWLYSDFELRWQDAGVWWKKSLIAAMYIFFRWVSSIEAKTLPDIHGLLSASNLHCTYEATFYKNLITARVYRKVNQCIAGKRES